ncbi:MAG: type IX secretion system protein PorQ [Prevotellaceae bacterium]|nr:type IX secretion system protein PorQ [Prevotellaceae bacterium]
MKKIVILTLLHISLVQITNAQAGDGVFSFLGLPPSSHVAALGGTNVSLHDNDLSLTLQNPALVTTNMHNQIALNGTHYFADINFGSAAYSYALDSVNFLSAGVLYVNYGKFDERNEYGEKLGEFSANDVALHIMYGRKLSEKWTLGATLKPIFSIYEQYSSFGIAVDLGLSYFNAGSKFSGGLVLKNIGRQLDGYYSTEGKRHIEPFPFEIQAGITKRLAHAPFQFSVTAHNLQRWDMSFAQQSSEENKLNFGENLIRHFIFGIDFVPSDKFYIAIGYNCRRQQELKVLDNKSLNGFTGGIGLKLYKFNLGFAIAKYNPSNLSYHISISTNLSSFSF